MNQLDQPGVSPRSSTLSPVPRTGRERPIALSYAQDRYWLLEQLEPSNTAYSCTKTLRLRGSLRRDHLERAIREVIRRHEAIRTIVGMDNGKPILQILSNPSLELELRQMPSSAADSARFREAIEEVKRRPFDLSTFPLVRFVLTELGPEDHLLTVAAHRFAADNYSLELIVQELGEFYSLADGAPQPQPAPLPLQFPDFARWQCENAHGDGFAPLVKHWRDQLAGDLPVLELATDRPRPPRTTYSGDALESALNSEVIGQLKALSMAEGVDFLTIWTTALSVVLRSHTAQSDLLLGTTSPNRSRPGADRLVGRLATVLPLRIELRNGETLRDLLRRVRDALKEAREHDELPFERMLEELKLPRDLSRHPLFQIMIEAPEDLPAAFSGLDITRIPESSSSVLFDLAVSLRTNEGWVASCSFNTGLFDKQTISALLNHVERALHALATTPDQVATSVEILTEGEKRTLLIERNACAHPFPEDALVHQLFEAQVTKTPNATAVIAGDLEITYAVLNQRANQLARLLLQRGVTPASRVGICLTRSIEMMVGILATLKAGGVYVPIDPSYPRDRQLFMISDAELVAVLTQAQLLPGLPTETVPHIAIDTEENTWSQQPTSDLATSDVAREPGTALLYMIFTSGSTGKPKGSLVYHRGFVNLLAWYAEELNFDASSRFLVFSSLSFDLTQKNLFSPLISGGALVLLDTPHYDAIRILDLAERHRATLINCTPSAFCGLLANTSDASLAKLQTLRWIILGGEPISKARLGPFTSSPFCRARVVNSYGPTECTDVCAFHVLQNVGTYQGPIPIGRPIWNTELYIVDDQLRLVPDGAPGELCIGGVGVGAGYVRRPELNQQKFVANPFPGKEGNLIYRTGDRVRYLPNGDIDFLGRIDHQIKLRGYRIELGEVTTALEAIPGVQDAFVMVREDGADDQALVAYLVSSDGRPEAKRVTELRSLLLASLPEYMVPTQWVFLTAFPLSPNGKIDRSRLPAPACGSTQMPAPRTHAASTPRRASDPAEEDISSRWRSILGRESIDADERFFDMGGTSLKAIQFMGAFGQSLGVSIPMVALFEAPTVTQLTNYLRQAFPKQMAAKYGNDVSVVASATPSLEVRDAVPSRSRMPESHDIAIVGMSIRVPGANNVEEYWTALRDGVEAVRKLSDEELLAAGVDPVLLTNPNYVKAAATMDDVEGFDASFFGMLPREVELMDPQHRVILESAHTALEHAGYGAPDGKLAIGVFTGVARDSYFTANLLSHPEIAQHAGDYSVMIGNEKDFPATRIAYRLDLHGPAINVQTACSSAGVALHLASQSLILGETDLALVGGCRVLVPVNGYLYVDGGTLSPDGHVRAFDAEGRGMVRGSGVGFLVLKRLDRAQADRDHVYAVIKGTAVNNDGAQKVGFAAPSVRGQAAVIRAALVRAQVNPETIQYVEAHGTGTAIGDPIEVAALTEAFRTFTDKKAFCALGSVKTNIGHLDAGSCVAGVIKTVLAMNHGQLPPSLNYTTPNPQIDFASSPFFVNAALREWPSAAGPRRAGVSSFGLGGTNVHVVLEEAPLHQTISSNRTQLLPLSARTPEALEVATRNLADHLEQHPEIELADAAFTLQVGRRAFEARRCVIAASRAEAITALRNPDPNPKAASKRPSVTFLFPGQGAQHVGMGKDLYDEEPVFRDTVDRCCALLKPRLQIDLREILFPRTGAEAAATAKLQQTALAQPALFTIEYALAQLLMSWGIQPSVMVGHSIGEYTAACIAGTFSLEETLSLVAWRGKLMQAMPSGGMRAVRLPEAEVLRHLTPGVELAACNGPTLTVVSGSHAAIATFDEAILAAGISTVELHTSHAFHSSMMDPILKEFSAVVAHTSRSAPTIPIRSTLTGAPLSAEQAMSPSYWTEQLRNPVRFSAALLHLIAEPNRIFLEVGPSMSLTTSGRQHVTRDEHHRFVNALPHANQGGTSARAATLTAMGRLFALGLEIDWNKLRGSEHPSRVGLPTYPFERKRYWVSPQNQSTAQNRDGKKGQTLGEAPLAHDTAPPAAISPELTSRSSASPLENCAPPTDPRAEPPEGEEYDAMAELIRRQLEVMSMQLDLLAGTSVSSPTDTKG